jgi:DNA-binding MarR family transcriptional regulator
MDIQTVREFRRDLRRLERLMVAQLREDTCCHGVTVAQCHCLLAVEQLARPSQNELAGQLCLDKSSLSRTVEGLVQIGLLARVIDQKDHRVYRIFLTEQGGETCSAINAANDALYSLVLDRLPMAAETVVAAFAAIVQSMTEVRDENGASLTRECRKESENGPRR